VQEVLQADWQDVWHSPQPLLAVSFNVGFTKVLMFFIPSISHHKHLSNKFKLFL
jgi:hypothetical protein